MCAAHCTREQSRGNRVDRRREKPARRCNRGNMSALFATERQGREETRAAGKMCAAAAGRETPVGPVVGPAGGTDSNRGVGSLTVAARDERFEKHVCGVGWHRGVSAWIR